MKTLIVAWFAFIAGLLIAIYFPKDKPQPLLNTSQPQITNYEITLECQKLSAMATKEDWGYKNCVDELKKSIGGQQLAI